MISEETSLNNTFSELTFMLHFSGLAVRNKETDLKKGTVKQVEGLGLINVLTTLGYPARPIRLP